MISIGMVLGTIVIIWAFVYTVSYGIWNWKKQNKTGSVMIFIVALAVIALPVYAVFLR